MISALRILGGLTAAGITAAIALTPTTSSDASKARRSTDPTSAPATSTG